MLQAEHQIFLTFFQVGDTSSVLIYSIITQQSAEPSCSSTSFTCRDTVNNEEGIHVNQQQAY